jgi:alkylhydroperoxidase family enzyme
MARLPYLTPDDLDEQDRKILLARNINLYRAMAHSPEGARRFSGLGHYFRDQSRLDPRLRELAIVQVGYAARSAYAYAHHIALARQNGTTDDDIRAVARESAGEPSPLEPLAKTVLRAAREMTEGLDLSDETFAALRQELDDDILTDLVLVIAFYNAIARALAALRIGLEDEHLHLLEVFPLPDEGS